MKYGVANNINNNEISSKALKKSGEKRFCGGVKTSRRKKSV